MAAPKVDTGSRRSVSRKRTRGSRRAATPPWRRRLRRTILLVLLLPFLLAVLYRPSFVHPISTLMLRDLVTLRGYDRRWTPLEEMGTAIVHSVMMSEDGRFCAHGGIDWGALNTVIEDALSGERTRGASTIPMQTVKNLFLWQGRSYVRKVIEVPLALYFDLVIPKRRTMEIYLNVAELGPNIYGVEAAAQHYFGVPARNLTRRQAALLAVTLPNPGTRSPARPSAGLNRLAGTIQQRALKAGGYVGCLGPD